MTDADMEGVAGFTPGPWRADVEHHGGFNIYCRRDKGTGGFRVVAHRRSMSHDRAESKANAHLIAAAPTMYEALHAAVYAMEMTGDHRTKWAIDQARAALSKANPTPTGAHDE